MFIKVLKLLHTSVKTTLRLVLSKSNYFMSNLLVAEPAAKINISKLLKVKKESPGKTG